MEKNEKELFDFMNPNCDYYFTNQDHLLIETLEGDMVANVGDYIIKGIKGEFYPCKPDVFLESYEEAK